MSAMAIVSSAMRMGSAPPVEPSGDEARRWAEDELSRQIYQENEPGLLERVLDWFLELIDQVTSGTGAAPPSLVTVIIVALVAVAVIAAFALGGPVRSRRRQQSSVAVFTDDDRSAGDLVAAADAAAAREDWKQAVVMRFRALVRSLDDRAIITGRPGLTAHEAATEASARLPERAEDLAESQRIFDDVCYGERDATRAHDEFLRGAADRVSRTRPNAESARGTEHWAALR